MKHSSQIGMASAYCAVAAMTAMISQGCIAASDGSESELDDSVQATRVAGSTPFPRFVPPPPMSNTVPPRSTPLALSLCVPDLYCTLAPEPRD
jgi:hypothetical protein